ncbi:MAG: hypothetical protein K0B05_02380 [Bacteroidales bacterium]|nr:hypothetical protein [Bacteroidales bacterium]
MRKKIKVLLPVIAITLLIICNCKEQKNLPVFKFSVSIADSLHNDTFDGRLLLIISDSSGSEPRNLVRIDYLSAQVFGMDVEGWEKGETKIFDGDEDGAPLPAMADIPPGEYYLQAVLHKYETFRLAGGHAVKLPMDRGEGQNWRRAPGNLFSKPVKIKITGNGSMNHNFILDGINPPLPDPEDTKYVRHIKIGSKLLSEFWGRPMHLGAHVLVPEGFDDHPGARYPICIFHGHFPSDFGGFRTEPPDTTLKTDYSERFRISGYNIIQQQTAYDFYRKWISKDFPRMLIVEIQHANPYYDDSYAVNSENLGPYGDAITYELLPEIERRFRGIGEGWARFLYGGSTGGWEALAAQVFYPDEYNGCFAACPDPVDFRAYCLVNIYEDENAYYLNGPFGRIERPGFRDWLGNVSSTVRMQNLMENAIGNKSRSGDQWDIWQAVFSPRGEDGYPKPIWDKKTGVIDKEVADYWRENYDLRYILERDWKTLGPKLRGKIRIYCGDMDNYYLNNAVYLMEEFLESTTDPYYDGEVDYGDRAEHCWNGDHERPNYISRLRYNEMYVPVILQRIKETAPPGADLTSWLY